MRRKLKKGGNHFGIFIIKTSQFICGNECLNRKYKTKIMNR